VLDEKHGVWYLYNDSVVTPMILVDGQFTDAYKKLATYFLYRRREERRES
jgi:hypothetical protein